MNSSPAWFLLELTGSINRTVSSVPAGTVTFGTTGGGAGALSTRAAAGAGAGVAGADLASGAAGVGCAGVVVASVGALDEQAATVNVIVTSTAAIRNKLMILLLIWKKAVFGYAA